MTHAVDDGLLNAFPAARWLMLPAAPGEVVSVLSMALGPDWAVEREIDCDGETSIIAMPARDHCRPLAFILYEKNGQARVAAIRSDDWESDRGFTSFREAVDALITAAKASSGGGCSPKDLILQRYSP